MLIINVMKLLVANAFNELPVTETNAINDIADGLAAAVKGPISLIAWGLGKIKEMFDYAKEVQIENQKLDVRFTEEIELAKQKAVVDRLEAEKAAILERYDLEANRRLENFIAEHEYTAFLAAEEAERYANMSESEKAKYDLKKKFDEDVLAEEKLIQEARDKLEKDADAKIKAAKIKQFNLEKEIALAKNEIARAESIAGVKTKWFSDKDDKLKADINSLYNELSSMISAQVPAFRGGVSNIQEDTMARLHAGERVVPASMNIPSMSNEAFSGAAMRGIASRGGGGGDDNRSYGGDTNSVSNTFHVPEGSVGIEEILSYASRTGGRILRR